LVFDNFDNETVDFGNNYNTTTMRYQCPVTANFVVNLDMLICEYVVSTVNFTHGIIELIVERYNSSFSFISEEKKVFSSQNGDFPKPTTTINNTTAKMSALISCNINDFLKAKIIWKLLPDYTIGDRFVVLAADFKIDTLNDYPVFSFDASAYRARLLRFKKNLSLPDFQTLRNAPFGIINVSETTDKLKRAWIKRLSYKRETSECNFELLM